MTAPAVPPPAPTISNPRLSLPTYTFPVTDRQRQWDTDPRQSFTIRSWTVGQELDAGKAMMAGGSFDYELLQRAIILIDSKPVDQAFNILDSWSPNMRRLAVKCLNSVVRADGAEEDDAATLKGVIKGVG